MPVKVCASMAEQRVVPMFSYEDVGRAADWIAKAFGFEETGRWSDESGRVAHVNMELDGGMIMLGYPSADYQARGITPKCARKHARGARRRSWGTACMSRSTTSTRITRVRGQQARRSCRSSRTTG